MVEILELIYNEKLYVTKIVCNSHATLCMAVVSDPPKIIILKSTPHVVLKGLKQGRGPFTHLLVSIFCQHHDSCKTNLLPIEHNVFIKMDLAEVWRQ